MYVRGSRCGSPEVMDEKINEVKKDPGFAPQPARATLKKCM
jgi:hypothetical protein